MELGVVVTLAVAFVGGSGFTKLLEVLGDRWRGATERRRAEVDAAAAEARAARVAADEAVRERRIALELLSATRRVALDHGVPWSALPPVELGD